jgi:uncharacterized membrane protein
MTDESKKQKKSKTLNKTTTIFLGIYMITVVVVTIYLLHCNWKITDNLDDKDLFLLVILAGALGSAAHGATSFASYIGNSKFNPAWAWWYVLRPFIGIVIAVIIYFVLRAGFLTMGGEENKISPYGVVAFAALAGMFSKNATDKLSELFDTLFKTKSGGGDDKRADKLGDSILAINAMIPKDKIIYYSIKTDDDLNGIKIKDFYPFFKGTVTRLPVLDEKGILKILIHQGLLYKFIAEKNIEAASKNTTFKIEDSTLKELMDHPGLSDFIINTTGFVSEKSTLSEARTKMKETKNCQDIIITQNGNSDEPIIGWLTNSDINKLSN